MENKSSLWLRRCAFLAACCVIFFVGCQNPLRSPPTGETQAETGILSLTIGRQGAARTILPELSLYHFARFDLELTPSPDCDAGNWGVTVWNWQHGQPIELAMGIWDLHMDAFTDDSDSQATAQGGLSGIWVTPWETTDHSVALSPVISGEGAFSWRGMHFPQSVVSAYMEIAEWVDWSVGGVLHKVELVAWGAPVHSGKPYRTLPAGQYLVIFTLYSGGDNRGYRERVEISEILHVYRNLETELAPDAFADFVFPISLITVTFNANNASGQPPAPWISEGSWSVDITFPGPGDLWKDGYYFFGWNTMPDGSGTQFNVGTTARFTSRTTLYAQWSTIHTLADRFAWLRNNAQSGGTYTIDISVYGGGYLTPAEAMLPSGRTLTVILMGSEPSTISLANHGTLFHIEGRWDSACCCNNWVGGYSVSLGLGNNVTLQGRHDNTGSMVYVSINATFSMGEGSKITGNTSNTSWGGGGVSVGDGVFFMGGGEISGNTARYGGGVWNAGAGLFFMDGGVISNNIAWNSGGGVYGIIRISNGVIYGMDAEEGFRNIANQGAALYASYWSECCWSLYGCWSHGNWSYLGTTDNTIRVTNGVRQVGSLTLRLADFYSMTPIIVSQPLRIVGRPEKTSRDITVDNPGQYQPGSIRWMLGGSRITAGVSGTYGETLTLDSRIHGNREGSHSVTVMVTDMNGVAWSQTINFTVVR